LIRIGTYLQRNTGIKDTMSIEIMHFISCSAYRKDCLQFCQNAGNVQAGMFCSFELIKLKLAANLPKDKKDFKNINHATFKKGA